MSRELEFGDEGPDVQLLQEALVSLGYTEVGTPDGRYSETTQEAMTRFQSESQLFGDGRFGLESQAALYAATSSAGTQDYFQGLWSDGNAAVATAAYGEATAEQWPDGQAWPQEDAEQAWTAQAAMQPGSNGGSGGADADNLQLAYAAQFRGAAAQHGSTPKVEFAAGPAGVPRVNGSQMEFKVRNEGWISIEAMTELGSYTIVDAAGTVVHGPVTIKNTIEIEAGHRYEVSHDIENIPSPIDALRDGDYTVKIELVAGARRSMKFKKHMGKALPR
jgi:peptidoglycan hydrolase-like protein with peptidoglycan-binding domain